MSVLGELPEGLPAYALLDGARSPRVRGFVFDSRAPHWCLFRGKLPPVLEDAAPWLLRLVPGQPYVEQFFKRGWNDSWGIVLASSAPGGDLRRHLRRFLRACTADGKKLLFRYYDPRVLRTYLPSCNREESTAFFGPIAAFAAPGAPIFRAPGTKPERIPWPWVIRREQLAAFQAAQMRAFEDEAIEYLKVEYPERCKELDGAALRASVQRAVSKAVPYKYRSPAAAHGWLDLMYLLGFEFDEDPASAWTRELLTDFALAAEVRFALLEHEARQRLGRKRIHPVPP